MVEAVVVFEAVAAGVVGRCDRQNKIISFAQLSLFAQIKSVRNFLLWGRISAPALRIYNRTREICSGKKP